MNVETKSIENCEQKQKQILVKFKRSFKKEVNSKSKRFTSKLKKKKVDFLCFSVIGFLLRKCRCRVVGMLLVCCARAVRRGWRDSEQRSAVFLHRLESLHNFDGRLLTITSLAS